MVDYDANFGIGVVLKRTDDPEAIFEKVEKALMGTDYRVFQIGDSYIDREQVCVCLPFPTAKGWEWCKIPEQLHELEALMDKHNFQVEEVGVVGGLFIF